MGKLNLKNPALPAVCTDLYYCTSEIEVSIVLNKALYIKATNAKSSLEKQKSLFFSAVLQRSERRIRSRKFHSDDIANRDFSLFRL